jgi:hypothetical protein
MAQGFASSGKARKNTFRLLGAIGLAALPLLGGSALANPAAVPATYATKAEAEAAASKLGCTGAHPMGSRWMPCAQHGQASGPAHSHH